jgi:aryl-alcohol dehydrogenase-like predicted oxidoreductase
MITRGGEAMKRRDLVRLGALAVGSSALGAGRFQHALFAASAQKRATDAVTLGRTGIAVSRLAQGTGTHGYAKSSDQIRGLGFRGLADLLAAGVDEGLAFWDLADAYGSHPNAREALKSVARDRVVIMTKTQASTEREMRADLDRFRREIGVDRIDIVLLHCMTESDWPRQRAGAMAVLSEAKAKGIIRAHGVSCHSLGALKTAAATDWVEIDLARLNPAGAHMDADPATVIGVLREMKAKGKGIIGMKILAQGDLRGRVDEALQYALAQDVLDAFSIGATSRAELRGLIEKIPAASVRA